MRVFQILVPRFATHISLFWVICALGVCAPGFAAVTTTVDTGHPQSVLHIRVHSAANLVLTADYSGRVLVRDLTSLAMVFETSINEAQLSMGGPLLGGVAEFSPDGSFLLVGSDDSELKGVIRVYSTKNFVLLHSTSVHGLDESDPRGVREVLFADSSTLLTQSAEDRERGVKVRAWRLSSKALTSAKLSPNIAPRHTRSDSSNRTYIRSADKMNASWPQELRKISPSKVCELAVKGEGYALLSEKLVKWTTAGVQETLGVLDRKQYDVDYTSLHCGDRGKVIWLIVPEDSTLKQDGKWITKKSLFQWSITSKKIRHVGSLGNELVSAAEMNPNTEDLILGLGPRNLIFSANAEATRRDFPVSAGKISALHFEPGKSTLVVDAEFAYYLGGEYIPHTYLVDTRAFNLKSGRQVYSGTPAACPRWGYTLIECAGFDGGYEHKYLKVISLDVEHPNYLSKNDYPFELKKVRRGSLNSRRVVLNEGDVFEYSNGKFKKTAVNEELGFNYPGGAGSPNLEVLLLPEFDKSNKTLAFRALDGITKKELARWKPKDDEETFVKFLSEKRLLFKYPGESGQQLLIRDLKGEILQEFEIRTESELMTVDSLDESITLVLEQSDSETHSLWIFSIKSTAYEKPVDPVELTLLGRPSAIVALPNGGFAVGTSHGVVHLFDKAAKEVGRHYIFPEGAWITQIPSGHYQSSSKAVDSRIWHVDERGERFRLSTLEETFYKPDLVSATFSSGIQPVVRTSIGAIQLAPKVVISSATTETATDIAQITLQISDRGGGVGSIRVMVNGSSVLDKALSAMQSPMQNQVSFPIGLMDGRNEIRVFVTNVAGTMKSDPATVELVSTRISVTKPTLHALVVGLDEFKDPGIKLKYAVSDAIAIEKVLAANAKLYSKINVKLLASSETTSKKQILDALADFGRVSPNDVFLLFFATHGLVDGESDESRELFLFSSEVGATSLSALRTTAISQTELRIALSNIPAGKKLVFLDACYSGEVLAGKKLLTRDPNDGFELRALSRSVGSVVFAASTNRQIALEGYKGHGLFTSVLISGIAGEADQRKRGAVYATDLGAFLEERVALIATREFGKPQYPRYHLDGQDFPFASR